METGTGKITVVDILEEQWANEWKKYYKPITIGSNIVIKPTWEAYNEDDSKLIIEMDPGMAFGTGTHETTSMCVELLENYVKENHTVLDIGTGSGILGIVCAKLGAKQIIGVDIDEMAVKVANENITLNSVEHQMKAVTGDLLEVVTQKSDIVVSNIIADVIINLSSQVQDVVAKDGIWIASGIIDLRIDDVLEAMEKNGWVIKQKVQQKEWFALVVTRGIVYA
ncbi:MAG: ribosomal protein L11 methyltransferase [Epulopiscium sp. Nele67-Bin005]|nr:MAG: ribosomal protein L11 methyltransferase [Epulopiscium sp. Nele67-Bin005]